MGGPCGPSSWRAQGPGAGLARPSRPGFPRVLLLRSWAWWRARPAGRAPLLLLARPGLLLARRCLRRPGSEAVDRLLGNGGHGRALGARLGGFLCRWGRRGSLGRRLGGAGFPAGRGGGALPAAVTRCGGLLGCGSRSAASWAASSSAASLGSGLAGSGSPWRVGGFFDALSFAWAAASCVGSLPSLSFLGGCFASGSLLCGCFLGSGLLRGSFLGRCFLGGGLRGRRLPLPQLPWRRPRLRRLPWLRLPPARRLRWAAASRAAASSRGSFASCGFLGGCFPSRGLARQLPARQPPGRRLLEPPLPALLPPGRLRPLRARRLPRLLLPGLRPLGSASRAAVPGLRLRVLRRLGPQPPGRVSGSGTVRVLGVAVLGVWSSAAGSMR